jgi:hypothetical protein
MRHPHFKVRHLHEAFAGDPGAAWKGMKKDLVIAQNSTLAESEVGKSGASWQQTYMSTTRLHQLVSLFVPWFLSICSSSSWRRYS